MQTREFSEDEIKLLWKPSNKSDKFSSGQVTIVAGSELFHGAPILALKAASRLVSMVYFATPEVHREVAARLMSSLSSFIWIPREDLDKYIEKSDTVLIGPGMMRNEREGDGVVCDDKGRMTKDLATKLFKKFPDKKWVVDGGALQVIEAKDLPKGSVVTPNNKELLMLFGVNTKDMDFEVLKIKLGEIALSNKLVIVYKGEIGLVTDGDSIVEVRGGNNGLITGGVGDLIAGMVTGFWAKNDPVLAAAASLYLVKKAAESLELKQGLMFNADDIAQEVGLVYSRLSRF